MITDAKSIPAQSSNHTLKERAGAAIGLLGLFVLILALFNVNFPQKNIWFIVSLASIFSGIFLFSNALYLRKEAGINWNGTWFKSMSGRGIWAWSLGIVLTAFYVVLYWFPQYLGYHDKEVSTGIVSFFDPLSLIMNGKPASQWFVYGTLYTVAILGFGYKFILKYRHNKYQVVRTISVMFFQLGFAYFIPEILESLNSGQGYFSKDLKYIWPLHYDFFFEWKINNMLSGGSLGMFYLIVGLLMIFVGTPLLTYFYGKRWYCSWVCGCGGLAETAGDPFRHLSDKSEKAWKFERVSVHAVLVFVFVMTVAVIYSYLGDDASKTFLTKSRFVFGIAILIAGLISSIYIFKRKAMDKDAVYTMVSLGIVMLAIIAINFFSKNGNLFFINTESLKQWYGFAIGAMFSGVIGVGFYPIMGNRVWCRFGCPMAALLGLQQRLFSRFRITTNGGQCISCGNCSNACEMGIDVREYAQKGENIVRSSCVGCGICSAVCPRGVLKLENGPLENRITYDASLLGNDPDIHKMLKERGKS